MSSPSSLHSISIYMTQFYTLCFWQMEEWFSSHFLYGKEFYRSYFRNNRQRSLWFVYLMYASHIKGNVLPLQMIIIRVVPNGFMPTQNLLSRSAVTGTSAGRAVKAIKIKWLCELSLQIKTDVCWQKNERTHTSVTSDTCFCSGNNERKCCSLELPVCFTWYRLSPISN